MAATKAALIIAFARADGVERLLKSCNEAGVETIYIAIDGPKTIEHFRIQTRMIDIINDYRMNRNVIGNPYKVNERCQIYFCGNKAFWSMESFAA